MNIKLVDSFPEEKMNYDEKIRMIYVFDVDGKRADMMTVIKADGYSRSYNMDMDAYYNGDEPPFEEIPKEILLRLEELACEEIEKEYDK